MRALKKAKIKVDVEEEFVDTVRVSFKSNENGPVELILSSAEVLCASDEAQCSMKVTILTLGEAFSLIQLPGETMLGHRNVIVANEQLEFV